MFTEVFLNYFINTTAITSGVILGVAFPTLGILLILAALNWLTTFFPKKGK